MSKPFHIVFHPPVNKSWKSWVLTATTRNETWNLIWATILINKKYGKIPQDIWNIIIGIIYDNTLIKDSNYKSDDYCEPINWMEFWITNPNQQYINPLYSLKNYCPNDHSKSMSNFMERYIYTLFLLVLFFFW